MHRMQHLKYFVEVAASAHGIDQHQLDLLIGADHEHRADRRIVDSGPAFAGFSAFGGKHAIELGNLEFGIADHRVSDFMALRFFNIGSPFAVAGNRINAQPDNFAVALGKLRLQARHVAQLRGANWREVLGVRKQDRPAVADPFMKVDFALCGFSAEVRRSIVDAWNAVLSRRRSGHKCSWSIKCHFRIRGVEKPRQTATSSQTWNKTAAAPAYNKFCMPTPRRRYPFIQYDVFASEPFAGNPLAVYSDARGLSDDEMQAIAKEMNLSETTFVLPRDAAVEKQKGIRVRIFTVQEELPFAGHPTLGTAFFLRGTSGAPEVALDLNVGRVPVQFEENNGQPVFGEMTQRDPEFGIRHVREEVARACGLKYGDIDPSLPIQTVSTGMPFTVVPLRGLQYMQAL